MIRVIVADDHEVVRAGFAALLATQADIEVVGTAPNGAEAVRLCRQHSCDVLLIDVRMPVLDGIAATRQILARREDDEPPRVLVMTTFDLDEHVYDALAAGASGFVLKDLTAEHLFEAVRVVASGEAMLAPTVTRRLITTFMQNRPARPLRLLSPGFATLTPREQQVLKLVAAGLSNAEIAARLTVTDETVKTHVSRVLTKLGVRDRVQAVVLTYESGWVSRSSDE